MSEWYDSQKKLSRNVLKVLQEQLDKTNQRRTLTAEENRQVSILEAISDKIKRGEYTLSRQLQTWFS